MSAAGSRAIIGVLQRYRCFAFGTVPEQWLVTSMVAKQLNLSLHLQNHMRGYKALVTLLSFDFSISSSQTIALTSSCLA